MADPYPDYVRPSDYVSIKLSGRRNYHLWHKQMTCLLESHDMLRFLEMPPPGVVDNEAWKKSSALVKGWILGSLSEDVIHVVYGPHAAVEGGKVVGALASGPDTATGLWERLRVNYGTGAGLPHGVFLHPACIRPSDYVSIKLLGEANYHLWHKQMTSLMEIHNLLHFINVPAPAVPDNGWVRFDALVKGWIFGSISEDVMATVYPPGEAVEGGNTASQLWELLRCACSPAALVAPANNEVGLPQGQFPHPAHVRPSDYVSIKLRGENYHLWHKQMTCLLEIHNLLHVINLPARADQNNENANVAAAVVADNGRVRIDALVRGWILGSISENVMDNLYHPCEAVEGGNADGAPAYGANTASQLWERLRQTYSSAPPAARVNDEGHLPAPPQGQFPHPAHVHPSDYVTIKLLNHANYDLWHKQMTCLMEARDMLHVVNMPAPAVANNERLRLGKLVKGWILGSLSDDVMGIVYRRPGNGALADGPNTAIELWERLRDTYGPGDLVSYLQLHAAIFTGNVMKAERLINSDANNALTAKINYDGHTALHVAIGTGANIDFVKRLMQHVNTLPQLITLVDNSGMTTLHLAAKVGNIDAAKELVTKHRDLLFIADYKKKLPIHIAAFVAEKATFEYLFYQMLRDSNSVPNPFSDVDGVFLNNVINAGQIYEAILLVSRYPEMARTINQKNDISPLSCIANKADEFYSSKQYNIFEKSYFSFVRVKIDFPEMVTAHPGVQVQIHNLAPVAQPLNERINPAWDWIRRKFWGALAFVGYLAVIGFWIITLTYGVNKEQLYRDKVKHTKAVKLLERICTSLDQLTTREDLKIHYLIAASLAVIKDTPEALRIFVTHFPEALRFHVTQQNIYQLAITNRSEKVYNYLVHEINDFKNPYKTYRDTDGNNLLHLAAKLAPLRKLNDVSGAALQMQREWQWFEEVRKFMPPEEMEVKNKLKETPKMMFQREHKELREKGEEWMRNNATSNTITAALIVTIVFTAAITVPGGNDNNGKAQFKGKTAFTVYVIADAISLITSVMSLLLFLSILTARYAYEDFLKKLPLKLILGILFLVISVTSMMITFGATLDLMYGENKLWILITIYIMIAVPIIILLFFQGSMLYSLITSTYGSGIFGRQSDGS